MSSEALERALSTVQGLVDGPSEWRAEYQGDMRVIRAEVARLEQERDHHEHEAAAWRKALLSESAQRSQAAYDAMEAALAVAREREQRLREAVIAWDNSLSSYCDGPERDAVRAALVDEPAAAIGRQAVDDYRQDLAKLAGVQTVASVGQPPSSASAAADEPTAANVDWTDTGWGRAAADEPGETP